MQEINLNQQNSGDYSVYSFYSFVKLEDFETLQPQILLHCKKKYVKGTILLAPEGFNANITGRSEDVKFVYDKIIEITGAREVNSKENKCNYMPFSRLKVKLKDEIVAIGADVNVCCHSGRYIKPHDWDQFITRPDVVAIDTRNKYEIEIGTFKEAINPNTKTFKTFPEWAKANIDILKSKKVAMFCTGGIRCEKSTALLYELGVTEVYHLEGGILQYLEDTGNKNGMWQGECFVFDDRIAVDANLEPSKIHLTKPC